MTWPLTPEGQKQFLADLIKTVKEAPEGRGIGVNYWHPEATYIPNATGRGRGSDANSLFDGRGYPLPAMNVLDLRSAASTPPLRSVGERQNIPGLAKVRTLKRPRTTGPRSQRARLFPHAKHLSAGPLARAWWLRMPFILRCLRASE